MAIENGYCTLSEIKAWCGVADTQDDTKFEACVEAVCRTIDEVCGRFFFITTETRRYRAEQDGKVCFVEDVIAITELRTDDNGDGVYEIVWDPSWYRLEPFNSGPTKKPYLWIETMPYSPRRFPNWWDVQIVAQFGVPADSPWQKIVKQAALIQTHRMFKRKDSPFGIAGANDFGQLTMLKPRLDPDVEFMLLPISRNTEVIGV